MMWTGAMAMPGVVSGTRKMERPRWRSASGSVRATQICRLFSWNSGMPCPPQSFWPLSTHSSPSRRARISMFAASEPALGSEMPMVTSHLPEANRGRYFAFCASSPAARTTSQA